MEFVGDERQHLRGQRVQSWAGDPRLRQRLPGADLRCRSRGPANPDYSTCRCHRFAQLFVDEPGQHGRPRRQVHRVGRLRIADQSPYIVGQEGRDRRHQPRQRVQAVPQRGEAGRWLIRCDQPATVQRYVPFRQPGYQPLETAAREIGAELFERPGHLASGAVQFAEQPAIEHPARRLGRMTRQVVSAGS